MTDPKPVAPEDIETPAPVEEPAELEEDDEDLQPEEPGTPPENETPEQLRVRLAASEEARKKLYARLQREKTKGKPATPVKAAPAAPAAPASATPGLTRDEGILFAKGFSEDEVEYANKVATLEGVKLTEAVNNDLFKGWKSKKDQEAKQRDAQLPASRGARANVKRTLATPGLSEEEHRSLAAEEAGK